MVTTKHTCNYKYNTPSQSQYELISSGLLHGMETVHFHRHSVHFCLIQISVYATANQCKKTVIFNDQPTVYDFRVQELCESPSGHPGLSILTSLMVSVDVKQH